MNSAQWAVMYWNCREKWRGRIVNYLRICPSAEGRVLEALEGGEVLLLEDVALRAELPVHEVAASMMMLELKRLVAKRADGRFERRG